MISFVVGLSIGVGVTGWLLTRPRPGVPPVGHPDRDVAMSPSDTCIWMGLTSPRNYSRDAS
ncbi:MAG: hypothetical protein JWO67_1563 [Streptosporangiaceae bacterium]|nr:hypothetical protein [Streptosporangiaceae bacterium]